MGPDEAGVNDCVLTLEVGPLGIRIGIEQVRDVYAFHPLSRRVGIL